MQKDDFQFLTLLSTKPQNNLVPNSFDKLMQLISMEPHIWFRYGEITDLDKFLKKLLSVVLSWYNLTVNIKDFELKNYLSLFGHAFLCPLSHSCFFSPFLPQCKIPNFYCRFLWKAPLNWPKIQNSLLLKNNHIVKWGNFVTSIKISTQNNLISVVLIWYLLIVNLLSFLLVLMHLR